MDELIIQMLEEIKQLKQDQKSILNRLLLLEDRTMKSLNHIEKQLDKLHESLDAVSEQTAELLEFKTASLKKINITKD